MIFGISTVTEHLCEFYLIPPRLLGMVTISYQLTSSCSFHRWDKNAQSCGFMSLVRGELGVLESTIHLRAFATCTLSINTSKCIACLR
ncbi:hypothetical protein SCLCIDRAFT_1224293 [Scleroderma citrinum Foug A]|uniref:Uncharacterized protein n=1 Tax=Scleroderma citrinum Foug A TaxID=1036808 RepID=A0A0C3D6H9_9AGAM|nr:hypothetical protein SCLCIDRAFT_1224293 [Scleroderma citrinum Foug A]